MKKSIKNYKKIKNKEKKILVIRFDDMTQDHKNTLIRISKFLNIKKSKHTFKILKKERVPRKKDDEIKYKKRKVLKNVIRPKIFKELEKFENSYKKNSLFV